MCWCCPWERLACHYRLCSLLFRLEVVFVRPWRVPSLALLATFCMVHFASVILAVTRHADVCQQRNNMQETNPFNSSWMHEPESADLAESYFWGSSYPASTAVRHTPQLARWGPWCSTTDHQDRCWDSYRSSPSGLALGTYQDKTCRGVDTFIESVNWYCKLYK